ncbi:hypothetical protein D4764_11G0000040 [Takifugu flavidus]|uniref:Uncharacterized protein n=1 Tax=Takifugu flavidus TaxID=433684 RepID=A0A5C6PED9_9TELE|nr:hypothetical protein D4764_11G0000040 [Takifugu flavidus]
MGCVLWRGGGGGGAKDEQRSPDEGALQRPAAAINPAWSEPTGEASLWCVRLLGPDPGSWTSVAQHLWRQKPETMTSSSDLQLPPGWR